MGVDKDYKLLNLVPSNNTDSILDLLPYLFNKNTILLNK